MEEMAVKRLMEYLTSDSEFISLLGTSKVGNSDEPMLAYALTPPSTWPVDSSCVNIYPLIGIDGRLEYSSFWFRASCHASSLVKSRRLANRMQAVLNRRDSQDFFCVVSVFTSISLPDSEIESYITPIEIMVRAR